MINESLSSDFDFFFKDEESFAEFKRELIELGALKSRSTNTNETYTLKKDEKVYKIQLIKIRYYKDAEDLLNSFDFTISQFAYDGKNLYCGDYALWDLARKRLALNRLTYGVSTMRRLLKYTNQGFTACNGVLQNILQAAIENPETVNTNIISVD